MKHAKNSHCRLGNGISRNVRCPIDDKFACPGNSAHTTTRRKIDQTAGCQDYPFIDQNGGGRTIGLKVCEDGVAIR